MAVDVFGVDVPRDHYWSVTVTTLSALAGVTAGLVSNVYVSDPTANTGLLVMAAFIGLQYPFFRLLGIDLEEFSAKDHLYVAFMTFSLWFVSWTIILSSGS